jgi:hypothetical protein
LDTSGIMRLALDLAGFDSIPDDSGIWVAGKDIDRVLFSVDAGTPEVVLAKQKDFDLLIAHHPVGPARLGFPKVAKRHVDFMLEKGVPKDVAEKAAGELVDRLEVKAHPANYLHEVDVARKLGLPFMNIHLPIDQMTRVKLLEAIRASESGTVGELVDGLGTMREFSRAQTRIELRMGREQSPLGNWALVFAAGTNGGYPVTKAYFESGVDTVICLHVDYDELVRLRKDCEGNLVVLGHMAGDSIGINLFLDELGKRGVEAETIGVVR